MTARLLKPEHTTLLIVDIQEKLLPTIIQPESLIHHVRLLIETAQTLDIPIVVSEQYPKGLGQTVSSIAGQLSNTAKRFEKVSFGCFGEPSLESHLNSLKSEGRYQVIVCGLEAHVCVSQTVHQLLDAGFEPHVVQDAISSRRPDSLMIGLAKMNQTGAVLTGTEMAMFELVDNSQHPHFKALQALIK